MTIQASPTPEKSTIVRSPRSPRIPVTVRAAFRGLELLAPAVGARWAYRLWFIVPPNGGPIRLPVEPGHRFVVTLRGRRIVGRHWGTGPRAIYLVHGWGGRAAQLTAFVQPLVAAGFSVVAFDGPSHGDSDPGSWGPRRSTLLEQAEALSAVVTRHGVPYAVIAHSGGCAAVAYALRDGMHADRLVFLAPMAHPMDYSYQLAAALGFGARTRTRLVRRIEQTFGVPSAHFDIPPVAVSVDTPPVLLVHDEDDTDTNLSESEAIRRTWPASRLVTTRGLGHHRILRDPDLVAQAVSFVAE
jgi:pimeloyl-ACP methyl ester carboxylesterase